MRLKQRFVVGGETRIDGRSKWGLPAFSVLRLPFIFRGSCQVLPMSDETGGGVVEGKRREDEQEKGGLAFQVMGGWTRVGNEKWDGWGRNGRRWEK